MPGSIERIAQGRAAATTIARPARTDVSVRVGDEAVVLGSIREPDVELAVWRRPAERIARWRGWLDTLSTDALPACRANVTPHDARVALSRGFDAHGTPAGPARDAFVADVSMLVVAFAAVTRPAQVRLRLDVVTDDACRRWHRDCVPVRLICTYRGPGTQWLPPDREAGAIDRPDEEALEARQFDVADVALFKGCGWPGQRHDGGIVHRSPRIAGTGAVRLVLVLEAASR